MSDEELRNMIARADLNADEGISREEFVAIMMRAKDA